MALSSPVHNSMQRPRSQGRSCTLQPRAACFLLVPTRLSVTFTPTDTVNYTTATKTVQLTVGQATPPITWADSGKLLLRHRTLECATERFEHSRRVIRLHARRGKHSSCRVSIRFRSPSHQPILRLHDRDRRPCS